MVQGVGFRPLVYHIAKKYKIMGTVQNIGGVVEIIAQAPEEDIQCILQELQDHQTGGHEIIKLEVEDVIIKAIDEAIDDTNDKAINTSYEDFSIIHSCDSDEILILPPDLPVCPQCKKELYDKDDRRYFNHFISCVSCGPRYTIIETLPYDRENTSMLDFVMCNSCDEEYNSPSSRRHHAQTISCNDCGPYLIYQDMMISTGIIYNQEALENTVDIINTGGIVAVKGIGGYHFVCSPFMEDTVLNLRKLKGREEKPFAVMFATIESIKEYCNVSDEEEKLLLTKPRPIVLLYTQNDSIAPSTNKGSIYCGAFLPYTPIQIMLTNRCGPLIMTSANIAGRPIIREDSKMLSLQSPYLQGVLYNKRRIVRSVDDSVAKILDYKPQLIRRSRGYVPYPIFISGFKQVDDEQNDNRKIEDNQIDYNKIDYSQKEYDQIVNDQIYKNQINKNQINKNQENRNQESIIFAAGGDIKAAFCLYRKGAAFVSQYFGDLEEATVMEEYQNSFKDLSSLLKVKPTIAVCDLHPNYFSTRYAKSLGLPVLHVQHHHAHIASVIAENDLFGQEKTNKVLGIAFDGTGYGTDGNIWGGEFLICEGSDFLRAAHLSYTPILGGDMSMKDVKKTATCYLSHGGLEEYILDERKEIIKAALDNQINTILTSSMGRLFDAVASILDIGQDNQYEGECAALLEREAVMAKTNNIAWEELTFAITEKDEIIDINPKPLLEALCRLRDKEDIRALALGFHYAVAEMIASVSEIIRRKYKISQIALSGGVFQNMIVAEKTLELLTQKDFEVYMNLAVPPNDGGISLGQTYLGLMKQRETEKEELE